MKKLAIIALCLGFSAPAFADGLDRSPEEPITVGIDEPTTMQPTGRPAVSGDGDATGVSVYDESVYQGSQPSYEPLFPEPEFDQLTIVP